MSEKKYGTLVVLLCHPYNMLGGNPLQNTYPKTSLVIIQQEDSFLSETDNVKNLNTINSSWQLAYPCSTSGVIAFKVDHQCQTKRM